MYFQFDRTGGIFIVILLILLLGAAFTDIKEGRIPNLFIVLGLVVGIFYRIFVVSDKHYCLLIFGILLPVVVFFPLFLLRAMGAGDIKLMAVTGAFFGISENVKCIVLAIFIAGIIAVVKLIIYGNAKERFRYSLSFLKTTWFSMATGGTILASYIQKEDKGMVKKAGIHFSVPLLLAAVIVMGGVI